uniref:Putative tick transposon n=1 Tax=Rhipicephalus microplus TaxID=6941 RepID=A0A6G5ABS6_RHIMP
MIAMYIHPNHTNWDAILPFVTFAYNTAAQRTTGFSPFFSSMVARRVSLWMSLSFRPLHPRRLLSLKNCYLVSHTAVTRPVLTPASLKTLENLATTRLAVL